MAIIWTALVFLLFSACSTPPKEEARADDYPVADNALQVDVTGDFGGVLRYALAGEPVTFNLIAAQDLRSRRITYLTTATLLEFNPLTQRPIDGVTLSHEFSEDGRAVDLEFRRNIQFSDGTPFTADDVLFTLQEILDPGSSNLLRSTLTFEGELPTVKKKGSHHVRIEFPQPVAAAGYLLTTIPILPRHLLEKQERPIEEWWTLDTPAEQMAGLGPFVIERHEPGTAIILRRNPYYWKVDANGNRLPYFDRVVFSVVPDRNNQLLRFQAGELDLIDELLRPEDFEFLEERATQDYALVDLGPSSNLSFYWFNLSHGDRPQARWFQDVSFRRAVSAAISRDSIVRNVYRGHASPAHGLIPSTFEDWYDPAISFPRGGPKKARSILSEAGYSWTSAGRLLDPVGAPVRFDLYCRADELWGQVAAVVQQDLEEIGMEVQVRQEAFRALISRIVRSRDYSSVMMNLDFPVEPIDYGSVLESSGSMHFWNPAQQTPESPWEAKIDQQMQLLKISPVLAERQKAMQRIQQILAEHVPFIPLVNRNILVAYRSNLKNLQPANIFPYALWNVWSISRTSASIP